MYVGVDDTDGPGGMCTTYLMTKILEEFRASISGYPRLVRLNPNIPYRTRGNGALSVRFGTGPRKVRIGFIGGDEIRSSVYDNDVTITQEMANTLWSLVKKYAVSGENTNPGLVIADSGDDGEFYRITVNREVGMDYSSEYLASMRTRVYTAGNGRGSIGAYSAISWPATRVTYEVLAYSYPHSPSLPKGLMKEAASHAETFDFTFNSMDFRNSHPSIFPNPRTPIIYGVRGTDPQKLLDLAVDINERFSIKPERVFVFETNQGTDDHISPFTGELNQLSSYRIRGKVISDPVAIEGGHYFAAVRSGGLELKVAAFEPTKEFRSVFRQLRIGDEIEVYGSYVDGTINTEKLRIISLSTSFTRNPPLCDRCKTRMTNRGHFHYTCRKCGETGEIPEYIETVRRLKPGMYEVPVCARRHLSAPLRLLAEESAR